VHLVRHSQIREVPSPSREGGKRSSSQGKRELQPVFVLASKRFLIHQICQHLYITIRLEQIATHVNSLNDRVWFVRRDARSLVVLAVGKRK